MNPNTGVATSALLAITAAASLTVSTQAAAITASIAAGQTVAWRAVTSADANPTAVRGEFTLAALPTSGAVVVGIQTREAGAGAPIGKALIRPGGQVDLVLVAANGQVLAQGNSGVTVIAGQRFYVELFSAGLQSGDLQLRSWRAGQAVPGWQLKASAVVFPSPAGAVHGFAEVPTGGVASAQVTLHNISRTVAPAPMVPAVSTLTVGSGMTVAWPQFPVVAEPVSTVRSEFVVSRLPRYGSIRVDNQVRVVNGRGVKPRALVDSSGRLYTQLVDRNGTTLQAIDTGRYVRSGQVIYLESAISGGSTGKIQVRAWGAGQSVPNWHITNSAVLFGATSGAVTAGAYLSANAATTMGVTLRSVTITRTAVSGPTSVVTLPPPTPAPTTTAPTVAPTATATATVAPTVAPTATATPTVTATTTAPTATATTTTPTATVAPTTTATPTVTATTTAPTSTPTATVEPTTTATATATATATTTVAPTVAPTTTATATTTTPTSTPTVEPTATATVTVAPTVAPTTTATPTATPTTPAVQVPALPNQSTLGRFSVAAGEVTMNRSATFQYPGATCQVDALPVQSCTDPYTVSDLAFGPHTVKITVGSQYVTYVWNVRSDQPGAVQPSETVAGVPAGLTLAPMTGAEDGVDDGVLMIDGRTHPWLTKLDGKDIRAKVRVVQGDVVITRSQIRPNSLVDGGVMLYLPNITQLPATLKVSDTTLKWNSILPYADINTKSVVGLKGKNITADRVVIQNASDGVNMDGGSFSLRNSLVNQGVVSLKTSTSTEPAHSDAVQISHGANFLIEGNRMEDYIASAIMVTPDVGSVSNVQVRNNWLGHGTCTVNMTKKTVTVNGVQQVNTVDRVSIVNNVHTGGQAPWKAGDVGCHSDAQPGMMGWLLGLTNVAISNNVNVAGQTAYFRLMDSGKPSQVVPSPTPTAAPTTTVATPAAG